MCGIIGIIGKRDAAQPLFSGLERLHNRGYDSAGLAILGENGLSVLKQPDKHLEELQKRLALLPVWGTLGIGHTRWATHGEPSERNAHPHFSPSGDIAIVHNGMVENLEELSRLIEPAQLRSETDTEVIAHLIEREQAAGATLFDAVRLALRRVVGAYAVAVISRAHPDELIAAASGSPLIIGTNDQSEWFVASETHAFAAHARLAEPLEDGEIALLQRGAAPRIERIAADARCRKSQLRTIEPGEAASEKGAHAHFMHKELHEIPRALEDALRGRLGHGAGGVRLGALDDVEVAYRFRDAERIIILGCGTSWYAAKVAREMLEWHTDIPTEAAHAAEWRYGAGLVSSRHVVIAVSQSGETRDVLEAVKRAKALGALTFSITNRVGSQLARETKRGVYLHAGPEVAVASTKAFACQVAVFALLSAKIALMRENADERVGELLSALRLLPNQLKDLLHLEPAVRDLAAAYGDAGCIPILGSGYNAAVAEEAALKLQEVAYHAGAHGFLASELKHGHIALVEPGTPVIAIIPKDSMREKMLGTVSEALARGAHVIALTTGVDEEVARRGPAGRVHLLPMPETADALNPILAGTLVQLFAYHLGVMRGNDVDKPRNLAKTVTVE